MNKPNKRKRERRNELRRAEARRQADLHDENDFLCNDFDTSVTREPSRSSTRENQTRMRYAGILVIAGLGIVLGILIDRLIKGL